MNFNSLGNKQKQKQANKMKIEFQNSIVKLSFLCLIKDIKIAWINNTCHELVLSDSNVMRIKNLLVHKRTLDHLAKFG